MEEIEEQDDIDYITMKKNAGDFCKLLTQYEQSFKFEISDWTHGLAGYVEVEATNGKVTFVFGCNGYVGIEVEEKEEEEE